MALIQILHLHDRRGSAVVEFALILPVFACLLFGILGYGQYFLLAHSVQQLANDAARATVAGLSTSERRTLAEASVSSEIGAIRELSPGRATTAISEAGNVVTVTVSYDASNVAIFRTSIIPMPNATIQRTAVARSGGAA